MKIVKFEDLNPTKMGRPQGKLLTALSELAVGEALLLTEYKETTLRQLVTRYSKDLDVKLSVRKTTEGLAVLRLE